MRYKDSGTASLSMQSFMRAITKIVERHEENMSVNLSGYNNDYSPGASILKCAIWYIVNHIVFRSWFFPFYKFKLFLLRIFGAVIGQNVVIKPRVNIKYPWLLSIGDCVWIGEGVWIDNLAKVSVGANACVSQGAYILTGNHDYTDPLFALRVQEILIEKGAWIGARSIVCPGVKMAEHSIVTVGSVLSSDTVPYGIYRGNPAVKVRDRVMRSN